MDQRSRCWTLWPPPGIRRHQKVQKRNDYCYPKRIRLHFANVASIDAEPDTNCPHINPSFVCYARRLWVLLVIHSFNIVAYSQHSTVGSWIHSIKETRVEKLLLLSIKLRTAWFTCNKYILCLCRHFYGQRLTPESPNYSNYSSIGWSIHDYAIFDLLDVIIQFNFLLREAFLSVFFRHQVFHVRFICNSIRLLSGYGYSRLKPH